MKTEKINGQIDSYQGRTDWPGLSFPLKYSVDVEVFENVAELRSAGAFPSDADVLDMVNKKRIATAKAGAYQDATKPAKAAYEDSSDYKRKNLISAAMAAGFSQADAEALAAQKLG